MADIYCYSCLNGLIKLYDDPQVVNRAPPVDDAAIDPGSKVTGQARASHARSRQASCSSYPTEEPCLASDVTIKSDIGLQSGGQAAANHYDSPEGDSNLEDVLKRQMEDAYDNDDDRDLGFVESFGIESEPCQLEEEDQSILNGEESGSPDKVRQNGVKDIPLNQNESSSAVENALGFSERNSEEDALRNDSSEDAGKSERCDSLSLPAESDSNTLDKQLDAEVEGYNSYYISFLTEKEVTSTSLRSLSPDSAHSHNGSISPSEDHSSHHAHHDHFLSDSPTTDYAADEDWCTSLHSQGSASLSSRGGCGGKDCRASPNVVQHWFDIPADRVANFYDFFSRFTKSFFTKDHSTENEHETKTSLELKPVYVLDVLLRDGNYTQDSEIHGTGTSDTYVKFKLNKTLLHKSRTVHKTASPRWVESFKALNLDRSSVIKVKLMAYKRGRKHPVIGQAHIRLADLNVETTTELNLKLESVDPIKSKSSTGMISICCTLRPAVNKLLTLEAAMLCSLSLPELSDTSQIINEEQLRLISEVLPVAVQCRRWELTFSTAKHGFSLNTLYRLSEKFDAPTLLLIKDSNQGIFGAFVSTNLRLSNSYYGSGESFLFTFAPTFQKFSWTGDNYMVAKGDVDSLTVGTSGGAYGLWLDGDLYRGRSERCDTFNNAPLATSLDFTVCSVESWSFI